MAGNPVYRFGDIEVDPLRGCLRRQGREQYPRSKVFQVLLYLLEHRDRVVTKQELIDTLWKDTAVTDDVVFHCVGEIRALLGDKRATAQFVRTFPAAGYRFVAEVEENGVAPPVGPSQPKRPATRWAAGLLLIPIVVAWIAVGRVWRPAQPSDAEVAWWRLDEGSGSRVRDSSGYRNDGAVVGNARWMDGHLEFEGVGSSVTGNRLSRSLPKGGEPRTITAWIKTASTNGDTTHIFHYGAPLTRSFQLCMHDNGRFAAGWPYDMVDATSRLDDGAWHFVAAIYEGVQTNVVRVFVDGVHESARKLRSPLDTSPVSPWRIGRLVESATPFRGTIQDVRVFARAMGAPWIQAMYRCKSRQADLTLPDGRTFYYLPVFPFAHIRFGDAHEIRQAGTELSGVQFARLDGGCAIESLRGADAGQDLTVSAEILVPPQREGQDVAAGPYFRSRAAAPGDGIIGGTSAGYWVHLHPTGVVKVRRLNPHQIVAFSAPRRGFDATRFHKLEVTAHGSELEVALDGAPVEFDQGGRNRRIVSIPPAWDGPPPTGRNQGTAGIAFLSEPRGVAGRQQARNLVVTPR
jgi:DNA-binding winged helix-turn-helix (wHTH) protein